MENLLTKIKELENTVQEQETEIKHLKEVAEIQIDTIRDLNEIIDNIGDNQ